VEVSGQLQALAALLPRVRAPSTHCIGGWVGLRVGLGALHCPSLELNPGQPAHSPHSVVSKLTELPQLLKCVHDVKTHNLLLKVVWDKYKYNV